MNQWVSQNHCEIIFSVHYKVTVRKGNTLQKTNRNTRDHPANHLFHFSIQLDSQSRFPMNEDSSLFFPRWDK